MAAAYLLYIITAAMGFGIQTYSRHKGKAFSGGYEAFFVSESQIPKVKIYIAGQAALICSRFTAANIVTQGVALG